MYKHYDNNDNFITLHDCFAEKITFENGVLSFFFPDGFWISGSHPENLLNKTVRTDAAQVSYNILDEEIDGITTYIFKKGFKGKIIREGWESGNFINAVNDGSYKLEFITKYKSYQSILYKCWVWFNVKPYHMECEIILHTDNAIYKWNNLCPDRCW